VVLAQLKSLVDGPRQRIWQRRTQYGQGEVGTGASRAALIFGCSDTRAVEGATSSDVALVHRLALDAIAMIQDQFLPSSNVPEARVMFLCSCVREIRRPVPCADCVASVADLHRYRFEVSETAAERERLGATVHEVYRGAWLTACQMVLPLTQTGDALFLMCVRM
jgi:hypothetical protein